MFRNDILAAAAFLAIGFCAPAAEARSGYGHGGGHYYSGGYRSSPWVGPLFGLETYAAYGYPYGYDNVYGYPGNYHLRDGGCYVTRERVRTRHGWRVQSIDVCE